jgi:hypothetical protein
MPDNQLASPVSYLGLGSPTAIESRRRGPHWPRRNGPLARR